MKQNWRVRLTFGLAVIFAAFLLSACAASKQSAAKPLVMVVMDPLSKEMACACVKGFGQRDYRKLAERLEAKLKQPVSVEFSDDLAETLKFTGAERECVVVGDDSLVTAAAAREGLSIRSVLALTDLDGLTTQTASFVVQKDDPATELKDINAREILFGLPEGDAKLAAASESLKAAGVVLAAKPKTSLAYSDAALDVLDSSDIPAPVAVIPSYALRLLEGCGSVRPGSLRVIGTTKATPFITVFLSDNIAESKRAQLLKALTEINSNASLLRSMESRHGFKPLSASPEPKPQASADWPDWRGQNRDGHVPHLPDRLPASAKVVWKRAAMNGGLAGLSVGDGRLIVAERDVGDECDVYRCLNADTGELLWAATFPAPGNLDYGQSPRATPVIHKGKAYLLGAFGELRCVKLLSGDVIWKRHLPTEFHAELPTWGMCSTPLIVDNLIIVNPGATNASLVALDCQTGETCWAAPGPPAAYSSFICGRLGGQRQIIGYDQNSLGGWEVDSGTRLWQLVPPIEGDFNVPTPVVVEGGLLLCTENNGARFHRFDDAGRIVAQPVGVFDGLAPDTSSPVAVGGRLFGMHQGLHCLDARAGLKPIWHQSDESLGFYASLIADDERVLVTSQRGELLLVDAKADSCQIISRLKIFEDDAEVYSHPALVGSRLFVRGGERVMCLDISPKGGS